MPAGHCHDPINIGTSDNFKLGLPVYWSIVLTLVTISDKYATSFLPLGVSIVGLSLLFIFVCMCSDPNSTWSKISPAISYSPRPISSDWTPCSLVPKTLVFSLNGILPFES